MRITVTEDGIELNSSLEALFWGLCCLFEIPVERSGRAIEDGHGGRYAPGFRVTVAGGTDIWVEAADGRHEDKARRDGRAALRAASPYRLAVLYPEELRVLMTRANSYEAYRQLQFWAR